MEKQSDIDNNALLKGADSPGNSSGSSMTPMLKASASNGGKKSGKKVDGYAEKLCAFYVNRPKLAFGKYAPCFKMLYLSNQSLHRLFHSCRGEHMGAHLGEDRQGMHNRKCI